MSTLNCKVDHRWYTHIILQLHNPVIDLYHHSKSNKRMIMNDN